MVSRDFTCNDCSWGIPGDELVGVLLADMIGKSKVFANPFYRLFVRLAEFVIKLGYKDASNSYDKANKDMLAAYKRTRHPDGELNFFAINSDINGKEIYLYTDSGSTYQFYKHRDFKMFDQKDTELDIDREMLSSMCMLFTKKLEK